MDICGNLYFYTTKEEEYIEEYIDYKIIINLVGNLKLLHNFKIIVIWKKKDMLNWIGNTTYFNNSTLYSLSFFYRILRNINLKIIAVSCPD